MKNGSTAVRILFPLWKLPDGRVVHNVSVFPHECSPDVCEEGDHVHVDTYDSRPATRVLQEEVEISFGHAKAIERMLEAQLDLNKLTHELAEHLASEPA
ncbi:MAG TPA: hypothetical protein VG753_02480 [Candidatus Paceibacterota bacterium]|nr:hypothetical protein [Candidatus Paceibacterota bacterium]